MYLRWRYPILVEAHTNRRGTSVGGVLDDDIGERLSRMGRLFPAKHCAGYAMNVLAIPSIETSFISESLV